MSKHARTQSSQPSRNKHSRTGGHKPTRTKNMFVKAIGITSVAAIIAGIFLYAQRGRSTEVDQPDDKPIRDSPPESKEDDPVKSDKAPSRYSYEWPVHKGLVDRWSIQPAVLQVRTDADWERENQFETPGAKVTIEDVSTTSAVFCGKTLWHHHFHFHEPNTILIRQIDCASGEYTEPPIDIIVGLERELGTGGKWINKVIGAEFRVTSTIYRPRQGLMVKTLMGASAWEAPTIMGDDGRTIEEKRLEFENGWNLTIDNAIKDSGDWYATSKTDPGKWFRLSATNYDTCRNIGFMNPEEFKNFGEMGHTEQTDYVKSLGECADIIKSLLKSDGLPLDLCECLTKLTRLTDPPGDSLLSDDEVNDHYDEQLDVIIAEIQSIAIYTDVDQSKLLHDVASRLGDIMKSYARSRMPGDSLK